MSSNIENFIKRIAKQPAVYWSTPTRKTDGTISYGKAKEVKCFWHDTVDTMFDDKGKEVVIKAEVYVNEDLQQSGMLYKGAMTDLSSAELVDPKQVITALEIKRTIKFPSLVNGFSRKLLL